MFQIHFVMKQREYVELSCTLNLSLSLGYPFQFIVNWNSWNSNHITINVAEESFRFILFAKNFRLNLFFIFVEFHFLFFSWILLTAFILRWLLFGVWYPLNCWDCWTFVYCTFYMKLAHFKLSKSGGKNLKSLKIPAKRTTSDWIPLHAFIIYL